MALIRNGAIKKLAEDPMFRSAFLSAVKQRDPNFARTFDYALKYQAVDKLYRFEKIGERHMPHLMDLTKGFFEDESISQATGSTIDNCSKAMEYLFAYSIAAQPVMNTSEICYENATNKPVGFRLGNPAYRDPSKAPFSCPEPTLGPQEVSLFTPLDESYDHFWRHYPNENAFCKAEAIYIDRAYRRKDGLYNVWVDYGVDFPTISKQLGGANYYVASCTSTVTKIWFRVLGYNHIYSVDSYVKDASGKRVKLPQGEIHMMIADLNKTRSINVKPIWDAMKELGMMEK